MDAKRYINTTYPPRIRENVREVIFRNLNGASVNLNGFNNLEKVAFFSGNFASLKISDLQNLKEIGLFYNNAASIKITNCPKLEKIYLLDNNFVNINIQEEYHSFVEVPTNCIWNRPIR
ncbi:Protein of unknown function [endosymbiont DhMRE of Dentiscutata heterogama]|uniref:hypothetical protein n=1 Tax=endosymbiont DhMRE of Dentiscutata heterogama TaxID=1609546 RepID=UPI000629D491|nr:hypothetical protein [endosymbiont DhMRE of Dentiscutata heterogama]CFW92778.1 Protein of unknown function [endosymbiont DhMRE of Dentiscutata heterogama]